MASGELEQGVIDDALGVQHDPRGFPSQRPGRLTSGPHRSRLHWRLPRRGGHRWDCWSRITGPRDLRDLTDAELDELASEIRDVLVRNGAPRGGHLGPNLGVVELTLAIHRVFDSPTDRVVFDTGHQAYVHKMLTGRAAGFDTLRAGGRPVRLPEPGRVRARHRRELPRLDRRCPTPTAWPRPTRSAARTATSSRSSATAR